MDREVRLLLVATEPEPDSPSGTGSSQGIQQFLKIRTELDIP